MTSKSSAGPGATGLVGQRFGRLVVLADSGERRHSTGVVWECQCDCGAKTLVQGSNLRSGHTQSCGCLHSERTRERFTVHGKTGSAEANMVIHARARAKRMGLPCTITVSDVRIPALCPAIGIPLTPGQQVKNPGSPTLDRLRPELGYVPGNVVVLSNLANTIKQNCTAQQVRAVGEWMKQHDL